MILEVLQRQLPVVEEKLNSIPGLHYKVILLKSHMKDSFVDVGDIQIEKGSLVFSAPTTNLNQNVTTVIDIMLG